MSKSKQLSPFTHATNEYFDLVSTGLKITGKPSLRTCAKYFKTLGETRDGLETLTDAVQLATADLLTYVEETYGQDSLMNIIGELDIKLGTYRNMKSVSRAFPLKDRRPGIKYGHYQALQNIKDKNKLKRYLDAIQGRKIKNIHHLRSKIKIDTVEADHAPTLREVLESHSKYQLVDIVLGILEGLTHEADITKNDHGRGALMAARLEIEKNIRQS